MHRTLQTAIAAMGLLFLAAALAHTQDATDSTGAAATTGAAGSPVDVGVGVGLGARSFEEDGGADVYQYLAFYPTFRYRKAQLGLDLTLHYTFTGGDGDEPEIREEDWVPGDDRNFLEVYLPKLRFLQWAQPGDPLFARLGSLDGATLGNGFLLGGYRNTLFAPDRPALGARVGVDGALIGFPYLGIEALAANLAVFGLKGGRLYARPFARNEVPQLGGTQVGFTVVADSAVDYYADKTDTKDRTGAAAAIDDPGNVLLWGGDLRVPIVTEPPVTLDALLDYGAQEETHGGMVGGAGRIARIVLYDGRIRLVGENFLPRYVDGVYDPYRMEKYAVYAAEETVIEQHLGWYASSGLAVLEDLVVLRASMEGPFGSPRGAENRLQGLFRLDRGPVPFLSVEARYSEVGIDSFDDLIDPENSVINARMTYHADPAAVSVVYNLRYDPAVDDYVITSGVESEISLR
mgnify:CR=1 FL=1